MNMLKYLQRFWVKFCILTISIILIFCNPISASIPDNMIRCTYYTGDIEGEYVGSHGNTLHYGIMAGRPEDYGKTVLLYDINHVLVGIYEIKDTGGYYIRNGYRLDIYFPYEEDAKEFFNLHGDYYYFELLEGYG